MQAWVIERHGEPAAALRAVDRPIPQPADGQVLVHVDAAGVGYPDVAMCRGTYPLTPPLPAVPGQEFCGTVVAIGDGVDASLVGQRVLGVSAFTTGHGSFAEHCLAWARTVHPVPHGLDAADAATFFISMHTAWVGLVERAALTEADRVLVLGAGGGSGLGAVALAAALGAEVIAVVGDDARAAACLRAGAATVVDHRRVELGQAVAAATGGHGATVVYDPVGGDPGTTAARSLASGGRHLLIGFASGSWAAPDPALLVRANISLVGVYTGAYGRRASERHHAALSGLVASGRLAGVCTARLPFTEAPRALTAVAERSSVGKIALTR